MIARAYGAAADRVGTNQLTLEAAKQDIARARGDGADLVIIYPHWGVEYRATPTAAQQKLARAIIDAGADMIIGNHAHWAAAMEIHNGKPIWYAQGNFVFDQIWSERTMQGFTLELTFRGAELVQAWMRPHIILDRAQPNFMDLTGDGAIVMDQVWEASKGLLPW
jgi:poly-gamma-glutamate capsule biosynthesis protein CapA/YwtB (metallophosphatase superfamily)